MTRTKAYAAKMAKAPLVPIQIERRAVGNNDVEIAIQFCGVCHSDIHQVRDEWSKGIFPMVPGHEITGEVIQIGNAVKKFKIGDRVGVGCFIDSCRECDACKNGLEQFCEKGMHGTYNSYEKDHTTPTYGGYSSQIVVDENYVLSIPDNLPLDKAAPLLCAGITTYSPLKHWKINAGDTVGVVGLGGLGHMAVKIASAMGAEVTVFSTSDSKKTDALRLGAKHFVNSKNTSELKSIEKKFKLIINTVSGNADHSQYLDLLQRDGTMVLVGAPEKPALLSASNLIAKRRSIAGSLIGGIKETQEMLNFCSKHGITADIEVIPINKINEAYERMLKSEVRYRFVIDTSTL